MTEKRIVVGHGRVRKSSRARTLVVCAVIAGVALVCGLFLLNRDDFRQVDPSTVLNQVRSGRVFTAKIIDAERRIEIITVDKKRFHAYWSEAEDRSSDLVDELTKARLPGGYSVEVPISHR
ncbi:hypothetical protein [Streptosporangium saharense]|uniref:hypothetical protein n=1 Tax=Streptosporangium saharense TaxID=1706840 RepID=UPI003412B348